MTKYWQQRNAKYKNEPNENFRTEKHNNWNLNYQGQRSILNNESIHQEDIAVLNVYTLTSEILKSVK